MIYLEYWVLMFAMIYFCVAIGLAFLGRVYAYVTIGASLSGFSKVHRNAEMITLDIANRIWELTQPMTRCINSSAGVMCCS